MLHHYGIPYKVISWIESFLSNRRQRVLVNGIASKWHDVISGVPQGSVLGPILFVIYINTLIDDVDDVHCSDLFLFADDNKLFREILTEHDQNILQYDIDKMFSWTQSSLLQFHPDKCYTMSVRSKSKQMYDHNYTMNERILSKKSEIKDLGILIDDHLTFVNHIAEKVNKANQIMGLIRRSFVYLDEHNFNLLFKSLVRPHLEYGNTIWSPFRKANIKMIENVQRRATKYVPKINSFEYNERLECLKLPTLAYRRFRGDMIETYKILHELYDSNCVGDLFTMKQSITRGHDYAVQIKCPNTTIRKNFFTLRVSSTWNSLPKNIAEATSLNQFKNKLDKLCKDKNIMFDPDFDFLDTYALSRLLKANV